MSRNRFKIGAYKRAWSKFRLGRRGRQALSRVLTSDEMPMETLAHFHIERAYTHPKEDLRHGAARRALVPIIEERKFAVPGINRFVAIIVRPNETDQELADGYGYFFQAIKKRFSHLETSLVDEGELALPRVKDARFIEIKASYLADHFRILCIACVVGSELLVTEFQCDVSSSWDLNDCERVILKQIDKLQRTSTAE